MPDTKTVLRILIVLFLLAQAACPPPAVADEPEQAFDVIVYGATPSGVLAAVAAGREGASVAIVGPTRVIGGIMSSGLSFSDSNQTDRRSLRGLFEEFHQRVEDDYRHRSVELNYQVAVKDYQKWTYEPHVAERVFKQMLDGANATVFVDRDLKSVHKDGARIQALVMRDGSMFRGKQFIDATYEGDLMAAAGVSYTVGRESRAKYGESLASLQFPKKPVEVSPLDNDGKLLPLINGRLESRDDRADSLIMAYSFRLCVSSDPNNQIPFPKPASYDPRQYELVRRLLTKYSDTPRLMDFYDLPNNKADVNNGISLQASIGLVGENGDFPDGDRTTRDRIWHAHKEYTLGLIHFALHDASVPRHIRDEMRRWGLAKDEFAATDHWPPVLYIREARRMIGQYVMTQADILENVRKPDSIAVGSFPIDSHDCQRVATDDGGCINEGTIFPVHVNGRRHGSVHQIPFRSLTPRQPECENLLVPVCLSCSHVAFSSLRVEPTWMVLGQSAGIAAAMAAKKRVAVQRLPYAEVRQRLLDRKQALDLIDPPGPLPTTFKPADFPGIVLDDRDAELIGKWDRSRTMPPYVGDGYIHDGNADKSDKAVIFRSMIPRSGRYRLGIAYSAHSTRCANVPIVIRSGDREYHAHVNQQKSPPIGELFQLVGVFELSAEFESTITISSAGTSGFVVVDAIQLNPVSAADRHDS